MTRLDLIWENGDGVNLEILNKVQGYFKLKFPKDYTEIIHFFDGYGLKVRGKDGKYFEPMIEVFKGREEIIEFYHYDEDEIESEEDFYEISIIDYHKEDSLVLPDSTKMVAFAGTSGKHHFLFDYRENEKEPSILFWDTDESIEDAFTLTKEEFEKSYNIKIEEARSRGFYKVADSFKEFMEMIVPDEE